MPLELEIDVPESRQVTLPDSVLVGKVRLIVQAADVPKRLERLGYLLEIGPYHQRSPKAKRTPRTW
jgi:hypothetical protein